MMSELSFDTSALTATPLGKSRRISILPIAHADLSSPTTARQQLQLLELENVGLSEELAHTEEEKQSLQAQVESLRMQIASSSSQQVLVPSTSEDSISDGGMNKKQRYSAEVKAARRLLQRMTTLMAAHNATTPMDEEGEESRLFNLDQSLYPDAERSLISPSSLLLTTPNKTPVSRGIESDLVDDIESLRSAWEESARKTSFAAIEQKVALQNALSQNQVLASQVEELQVQLAQSQALAAQAHSSEKDNEWQHKLERKEKELQTVRQNLDQLQFEQELTMQAAAKKFKARIEGLQLQIEELEAEAQPDQRIIELQTQLTEANKQIELLKSSPQPSTTPAVDEAELETLTTNLAESEARVVELEAQLSTTSEKLQEAEMVAEESTAQVSALQAQLEERQTKSANLQNIFAELQEKKDRLHSIQIHNSQISSLQRVLTQQERIVSLLTRSTDLTGEVGHEWKLYAEELGASLINLKAVLPAKVERVEAGVATDEMVQIDSEKEEEKDQTIISLREKVEELEARVLRRNEQIGSLQRQLKNAEMDLARTRTNQMLAEETVVDLDAERSEHLAEIKELQDQIASLQSSVPAPTAPMEDGKVDQLQSAVLQAEENVASLEKQLSEAVAQNADLQAQVEELDARISELNQPFTREEAMVQTEPSVESARMGELKAALTAAEERITTLTCQIDDLTTDKSTMLKEKLELERKIDTLTSNVQQLETSLASQTELSASAASQAEEELISLRSTLRKIEDRLSATLLELDSVQLALAEQRESSSSDSDRIESLQAELSGLQAEHEALLSSSSADQATISELRAQIGGLESDLASSSAKLDEMEDVTEAKAKVEAELVVLQSKHTELERVLAERDQAITARNTEYWNLKEELAELQEEAERSLPAPLISAEALTELQSRVAAQESALLKLKSDLSAARSTEELLNEQYSAAQRRVKDLESLLSQSSSASEDEEMKEKLNKAEEEVKYLEERVGELEEELGRKAEEIEEADSKILDALKESKKFATRYAKLSAKYEGLQREKKDEEAKRGGLEEEVKKLRSKVTSHVKAGMERSDSGSNLAGRKRAKPDSVEEEEAPSKSAESATTPAKMGGVKAVFAPSPNPAPSRTPSSFTPIRRTALLKSASRSTTNHTPIVLGIGLGTPSTITNTTDSHTLEGKEGGMVRSTSNPSELIAARLLNSPAKPALLSDKTNLTTKNGGSGTSRLSSKLGATTTATGGEIVKPVTTLLPNEDGRRRGERDGGERKKISHPVSGLGSGGAGGGGGAADFLAKMKAQRAART